MHRLQGKLVLNPTPPHRQRIDPSQTPNHEHLVTQRWLHLAINLARHHRSPQAHEIVHHFLQRRTTTSRQTPPLFVQQHLVDLRRKGHRQTILRSNLHPYRYEKTMRLPRLHQRLRMPAVLTIHHTHTIQSLRLRRSQYLVYRKDAAFRRVGVSKEINQHLRHSSQRGTAPILPRGAPPQHAHLPLQPTPTPCARHWQARLPSPKAIPDPNATHRHHGIRSDSTKMSPQCPTRRHQPTANRSLTEPPATPSNDPPTPATAATQRPPQHQWHHLTLPRIKCNHHSEIGISWRAH